MSVDLSPRADIAFGRGQLSPNVVWLRDADLAERFGVTRKTVWEWVKTSGFPRPVKLSRGCTRWRLRDVVTWEASRG